MDKILSEMKKAGRSTFRTREYAALLGKGSYARLVLHRLNKKGEILPVKNGWWAFPDALAESVACAISSPSYVSFHSALSLHNVTTQIPRFIQLAVARNARQYRVFGTIVKEYRVKMGQFNNFSRKDGLFLATPEKAFADCLVVPRSCPNIVLSEAIGSISTWAVKRLLFTQAARSRLMKVMENAGQR